jgi:hypothetical protein
MTSTALNTENAPVAGSSIFPDAAGGMTDKTEVEKQLTKTCESN